MKILMTGASGLLGQELGIQLVRLGHELVVVSRSASESDFAFPCRVLRADLATELLSTNQIHDIEAVIHLMGESIQGRWTQDKRQRIYQSRVQSTKNLIQAFLESKKLKVFVSASAVGIYGDRSAEVLTEDSFPGEGFLAEVCKDWEKPLSAAIAKQHWPQARCLMMRFGVVLSAFGGAWPAMTAPFRRGVGAALGSGQQWLSWIHIEDAIQILLRSLTDSQMSGVYHVTAPEPVTNAYFSRELAKRLHTRCLPNVPSAVLKTLLGDMSSLILSSQRAEPRRLLEMNFQFRFPLLIQALDDLCQYEQNGELVFRARQYLPYKANQVFPFFSEAKNLEKITPQSLNFQIQNISTEQIEEGTLIDYRLRIHGVPVFWRTRIEEWKPNERFVDTQLKGPYKMWHHTHQFEPLGTGTLMTDFVRYQIPLGIVGDLLAGWLIKKDIENIFRYRRQVVKQLNFNADTAISGGSARPAVDGVFGDAVDNG